MSSKSYSYTSRVQLTKNINVSELKCKGSKKHSTIVGNNNPQKVQNFMDCYGYTKVIINSGYRCKAHDKKVGGSGYGQHTKGTAIDAKFYRDGKLVSAETLCCNAQDFGFKGVAFVGDHVIHLDSRSLGTYRGDERKGRANNVGGDFYKYFKIGVNYYQGLYPKLPSRKYFKKNDSGLEVMKVQAFLNWSMKSKLNINGIYNQATINAVKKFQKRVGLKADGLFGSATLKEAKEFIR